MKGLASLLALTILLHGVCITRCIGEQSRVEQQAAVPPCDHHNGESPNGNNSPHSSTCSEGPALEIRTSPVLKCTLNTLVLPEVIPVVASISEISWLESRGFDWPQVSPPLLRISVLRI